jgi:dihydroneopterin aldolase
MKREILIEDLEVFYRIGITEAERAKAQRLLLCIALDFDYSKASESDDIEDTINYFTLAQELLRFGEGRSWNLLEKLVSDIARHVLKRHRPRAVRVTAKKFPIPEARHVAVSLELDGSQVG